MAEKVIRQDDRFIVVDTETGEVLDDAQGYGDTTAQKAYKGYYYKKNRQAIEAKMEHSRKIIEDWLKRNPSFESDLELTTFDSLKYGDKSYVDVFFKQTNPPFTQKEYDTYLRYKYKKKNKDKRRK